MTLHRRDFIRTAITGAAATVAVATALPAFAQDDWRKQVPKLRIGVLGGENEADRIGRYENFRKLLSEQLGIPAELHAASDYAGVMQAWSARQLEVAMMSPNSYAGIWLDTNGNIEPLVITKESDGSIGYRAMMYVRSDSPFKTLDDLKGKSLAYADPNSASGFLVPRSELREMGKDPEQFFSRTGFAGGHEQAVVAVLQGQYDAGVTWTSGVGDVTKGYSRGALQAMVEKGRLDMSKLRIVWTSRLIPNGPFGVRKDLPDALKQRLKTLMLELPTKWPDIYRETQRGAGAGFEPASHEIYEPLVTMRRDEARARRDRR